MGDSGCKFVIIHEVLSKENNLLSASMLCGIAGVSRSDVYKRQLYNRAELLEKKGQSQFAACQKKRLFTLLKRGVQCHFRQMERKDK